MSRLLSPAPLASSRASHTLPTVKCSSCGQLVPLTSLVEHACSLPQPPEQSSQQIPPVSSNQQSQRPKTPSIHPAQPTQPPLPGFSSHPSQQAHTPSIPHAYSSTAAVPLPSPNYDVSHVPFPSISTSPPRQEDYMPGGESGMAGVGRRAFQAAAHAALLSQYTHYQSNPSAGLQNRRTHTPQFLDITRISGRGTPPLSPNSSHSHSSSRSLSPLSPLSQSPAIHADLTFQTRTPSPAQFVTARTTSRTYSNASSSSPSPSTPSAAASKLPFFQKYKNTLGQTPPTSPNADKQHHHDTTPRADDRDPPPSPTESDHSASEGLAYDRDDTANDDDVRAEASGSTKRASRSSSRSAYSAVSTRLTRDNLMLSSSSSSPRRSHTTPMVPRGGTGGIPRPLKPSFSPPPGGGAMRSISDAKNTRRGQEKELPKLRICVKCEIKIDNGRWIRMDNGKGVLCEDCWKNMYLPKCRRCDKPIEKAAVFSSDGQLKGKYHRACFTCATCHTPFPDNTFYVHSGQPLCAFHYHRLNRSLCTALTCGKPIEGACAITYSGDRFHPACLKCSQAGCGELLEEYWDMDSPNGTMMLCERHARIAGALSDYGASDYGGEGSEEEEDDVLPLPLCSSAMTNGNHQKKPERAQKRTTKLITLTGAGLGF